MRTCQPGRVSFRHQMCRTFCLTDLLAAFSLATETEYVRSRLAQYGNDLLSLGVDGLRLDAAKRKRVSDYMLPE